MNQTSFPFAKPKEKLVLEPSPDEIRICTKCGRQIITRRRLTDGQVQNGYVGFTGQCWGCDVEAKHGKAEK